MARANSHTDSPHPDNPDSDVNAAHLSPVPCHETAGQSCCCKSASQDQGAYRTGAFSWDSPPRIDNRSRTVPATIDLAGVHVQVSGQAHPLHQSHPSVRSASPVHHENESRGSHLQAASEIPHSEIPSRSD